MNKKAELYDVMAVVISIFMITVVVGTACGIWFYFLPDSSARIKAYEESCNKIDMEYFYKSGFDFCIDDEGNANYVIIDCTRLAWKEYQCIPKIISIGDVRLKGERE